MDKEIKTNLVLALMLIFFSVALLFFVIPSQINEPSYIKSKYLSPAFVPRVFTIYLGLMALVLFFRSVSHLKKSSSKKAVRSAGKKNPPAVEWWGQWIAAFIWISCCLFILAVEFFGILIPSILFLGALMVCFGQKKWLLVLSVMILVPLLLYLFLHDIANVQFPQGILFR
jgi:hypothetical protein